MISIFIGTRQCYCLLEWEFGERMGKLLVVKAAIRTDDGRVWSVDAPGRHYDVIVIVRESGYMGPIGGDRQGFVLSDGRFVGRKAAGTVARKAGQLKNGKLIGSVLTSEDLW